MNIDANTKITVNGILTVDTVVLIKEITDVFNVNGIIQSYNQISVTSIIVETIQSDCFELISSTTSFSFPTSISDGYSLLLLSQDHLLRVCPSTENYTVECTMSDSQFNYSSFDLIHCPCVDSNCIINVNFGEIDTTGITFDGTFNIILDSVILISSEITSFSVSVDSSYKSTVIGFNSIGFSQTNLKSGTNQIITSTEYPCKSLLFESDSSKCIICDADIIVDGICSEIPSNIANCDKMSDYGCDECVEGYESKIYYCNECPSNCLRCYNGDCVNCDKNYRINETNECEFVSDHLILYENSKVIKCNDGYYSNTNDCIKCSDSNCLTCNSSQCLTCNNNYTLSSGNCQSTQFNNGEEIISNYGVIGCNDGYYSNNSQCIDCSITFNNCELCNINGCFNCTGENNFINEIGICSIDTGCLNVDNSICLSCNDKGSWFNGNECLECGNNCKNCINGYCIECEYGYILQNENNCVENEYPDNCTILSYYGTCQRCSDGYYLNNNLCIECGSNCLTCHNLTYCFECNDGYMLNDNNTCEKMTNCKQPIPGSSGGCAICNDGYYREQTTCYSCISNCNKCNNGESCLSCESNYFLLSDASECISYDDLTNCENKTQNGCTECINDNYYLNNQYCKSCDYKTENCNTCTNNGECSTCQNNYVLVDNKCIYYQLIDNCKESSDSKCTSCSFWHTVNSDQTGCDTQVVWWFIMLIMLIILIIFICIILMIILGLSKLFERHRLEDQRKEFTIFDMSRSNIQFIHTNNKEVVINKREILFNDESEEIKVNKETRDLICVGNTSKHTIKVQFSVKEGCDKYEIRTNPQLISIPKGKACEFEIFIKPLCTCAINDKIMLISSDLSKGKTITTPIQVNTVTIMTSRLDYSELIEEKRLGAGSFGIVYKGTFRGNQVAIKRMKNVNDNELQMKEFEKEVSMLDKFRSDYIVHFYGAVFIPSKICMVTEFAQYSSLQDLVNKRKSDSIDNKMRFKIILDCAKGIEYLHSNGILHRDIKPDNFLIFSLEGDVQVNAKLTDFGSSRNINMMMTNMTFTNGIGTPIYMAPEILQRNKYKKPADIYSFAITMFETFKWGEAYDANGFEYPWLVASFIVEGKRLSKPDTMNEKVFDLIMNCWKQEPNERYTIEEVISRLEELN